ncbi:MAG: potassium-transporting ATPase subunit KdpC [Pseudomonadota bacterium]|nr:potassium-transporting ATPase subunit KdpC [Pseudomonadota bacterium]
MLNNTLSQPEASTSLPFWRPLLSLFVLLTLLLGLLYPMLVTGLAQWWFPQQAAGQLIVRQGQPVGSALIGQSFSQPIYLWGRPSASDYDAMASGGSNLGALNPVWIEQQQARLAELQAAHPDQTAPVPVELLQASASGLDPEISVDAANWQASRIAVARGVPVAQIEQLIATMTQAPTLQLWGQSRVNVLAFNLALDQDYPITALKTTIDAAP